MNIFEIAEYIIKENPECCLACNSHGDVSNWDEEQLYTECLDFFLYEDISICGCGSPQITLDVIKEILTIIDKYEIKDPAKEKTTKDSYDEKWNELNSLCGLNLEENQNYRGMLQFIMYILDDKGFLEHGSSIGGAWITEKGRMLLYVLNATSSKK